MDSTPRLDEHLAGEASEWFARLRGADGDTPEVRAQFSEWLLRSPLHVREYLAVSRVWSDSMPAPEGEYSVAALEAAALAELESKGAGKVVALNPDSHAQLPRRELPRSRILSRPIAAVIATLTLGLSIWLLADRFSGSYIQTGIGELRSVTLTDGSVVDINTSSAIRIDVDGPRRAVSLLRGEARFKVAKDPRRPFIVIAPQATVRAVGTVFNVRAQSTRTAVAVLEGRVEVRETSSSTPTTQSPPSASVDRTGAALILSAGQLAAVTDRGEILPGSGPSLDRVSAWTERRLVFRNETLAEVVAEFNRYNRRVIRIDDPVLADLRINGTFDSSDRQSFIEYLQQLEGVRAREQGDATVLY
jgi:transmembrane sensor